MDFSEDRENDDLNEVEEMDDSKAMDDILLGKDKKVSHNIFDEPSLSVFF